MGLCFLLFLSTLVDYKEFQILGKKDATIFVYDSGGLQISFDNKGKSLVSNSTTTICINIFLKDIINRAEKLILITYLL